MKLFTSGNYERVAPILPDGANVNLHDAKAPADYIGTYKLGGACGDETYESYINPYDGQVGIGFGGRGASNYYGWNEVKQNVTDYSVYVKPVEVAEPTPEPTPTVAPTPEVTPEPTPSETPAPTPSESVTPPAPTVEPSPSTPAESPTPEPVPTSPTAVPSVDPTPTATTPVPSVSPSETPAPTPSESVTPPAPTVEPSPSTPAESPTPEPVPTSPTAVPSVDPTPTATTPVPSVSPSEPAVEKPSEPGVKPSEPAKPVEAKTGHEFDSAKPVLGGILGALALGAVAGLWIFGRKKKGEAVKPEATTSETDTEATTEGTDSK